MISQDTIEAVRQRVSIVSIVGERVRLERRGRALLGLCPFHKEKTPSFNVNPDRGFYHCFGCDESGNVITFVEKLDGLTFPEAVRMLAEREGIEVREDGSQEDLRREAEARRRRDELYAVGTAAAEFFERCLREHPLAAHARAELQRRGLALDGEAGAQEALAAFKVGYAPHGWEGLTEHLRQKGLNLRAAEAVGLIGERKSGGGYYDRFRHRLTFAVVDLQGRLVAFSGRSLPEPEPHELPPGASSAPADQRVSKYYNSPESPVYRKREVAFGLFQARQAVRQLDRAVVVEGNFDVVSLHARGIQNVVAPLGTAFTDAQARQIKRYTSNVTFLFDGDAAGQRATAAAREPCRAEGLLARVARLPDGLDPDDLIRKGGSEVVERVLKGAQPLLEYLIDTALQGGFSADDAHARAAKLQEVGQLISSEDDPAVRAMAERHADEVAGRLGMVAGHDVRSFRALRAAVLGATRGGHAAVSAPVAEPPERARSRSRVAAIRQQILGAALEYPALLEEAEVVSLLEGVEGDLALGLTTVGALERAGRAEETEVYVAKFPEALRPVVARRLASPEFDTEAVARTVLVDNLTKLLRLHRRRERASVVEELRRAAASGDEEAELSLLQRQLEIARARHGLTS